MVSNSVFICSDGHGIAYNLWLPANPSDTVCFVQILHGLGEYGGRYERFAKYLNRFNIGVFAADYRGHGAFGDESERGWFAEKNGWNRVASDVFELADFITTKYRGVPSFLLGQSMGCILGCTVVIQHPLFYSGLILVGTPTVYGFRERIASLVCKIGAKSKGFKAKARLMYKFTFKKYNKPFMPCITEFDWLSSDQAEVASFVNDYLCMPVLSFNVFGETVKGMKYIKQKKNIDLIQKDFPIYLISGENDSVGEFGKGMNQMTRLFSKAGISDVKSDMMPGTRHALIFESNKASVFKILKDWISERV